MLKHNNDKEIRPSRVVVLGATGFVGGATLRLLNGEGIETLGLGRKNIDLLGVDAGNKLSEQINSTDVFVIVSAEAPCKDGAMLLRNIQMMKSVCDAIEKKQPQHVVYISSDAVYSDSPEPLNEASVAEPGSMHGVMHLAREIMLKDSVKEKLAILRPTLIYGKDDPHNGYGPNRFRRLCENDKNIVLFGEGEERRDHVSIEDVASIISKVILRKSEGILNIATGDVKSFKEIAEMVVALSGKQIKIEGSPREGSMPHDGYRPFDSANTYKAFPDFKYTLLQDGLKKITA